MECFGRRAGNEQQQYTRSASLSMASSPATEKVIPYVLIGMTAVTGLVDAVSFLSLGHVFTANMTGNVVFLAFAFAGVPGLSIARSSCALGAFLVGALVGGRTMADRDADSQLRWTLFSLSLEIALLFIAIVISIGYRGPEVSTAQLYSLIVLTGLAMGIRNATIRKLAVPDLTTTVLTLTVTGLAADSSLAGGGNPRWQRRAGSVIAMFVGAGLGAVLLRNSLTLTLGVSVAALFACCVALTLSDRVRSTRLKAADLYREMRRFRLSARKQTKVVKPKQSLVASIMSGGQVDLFQEGGESRVAVQALQ
jgi:uncharacterized membrane protein YoaK (UPF0700 family)